MTDFRPLSKARLSELAKLKQKKNRQDSKLVIVEGYRLLRQLSDYGVVPIELYIHQQRPDFWMQSPAYILDQNQFSRICESGHPADIAALLELPVPRKVNYQHALYLDRISDPGNLGTIFRSAAAFGVDQILISEDSCEISNPKVIRASLGAVYKVPYQILSKQELAEESSAFVALDMDGEMSLKDYSWDGQPAIFILGSEAHGVDQALLRRANTRLRIPMSKDMESLNVAATAAILAYQLSQMV